MTSFLEARAKILDRTSALGKETVSLESLSGRVLAENLFCPFDVPHFDNSQVDGYAVRAADSNPRTIVGTSVAGSGEPRSVAKGEAVRIYTGAPMPLGADAVAMQEDSQIEGDRLQITEPVRVGENVRYRGEEVAAGTAFETMGALADPPVVGLAASFGLTAVSVYRTPRAAIVATGDELVAPGNPLGPGQIYASNVWALRAALESLGVPTSTYMVRDDPKATEHALREALDTTDIVLTVGGVSVGDRDLVRPALTSLGVEEIFWRVSMKPGKPFYFGQRGAQSIFGLPGNPVSALVTFYTLVRPAVRKMLGLRTPEEEMTVGLGAKIERKGLRYEFVRVALSNGIVLPVSHQGSHMQTGLAFADALLHVPGGVASIEAGEPVTITPLRWGLG